MSGFGRKSRHFVDVGGVAPRRGELGVRRAGSETKPIEASANRGQRAGNAEMFHRQARAGDETKPTEGRRVPPRAITSLATRDRQVLRGTDHSIAPRTARGFVYVRIGTLSAAATAQVLHAPYAQVCAVARSKSYTNLLAERIRRTIRQGG